MRFRNSAAQEEKFDVAAAAAAIERTMPVCPLEAGEGDGLSGGGLVARRLRRSATGALRKRERLSDGRRRR